MSTRDDWLDEGLRVLADEGAPGLRTDRIAARLGLTKGSFHHHFPGAAGYRRALLAHYEAHTRDALDRALASAARMPPLDALAALREQAAEVLDPRLETAVRAWAFQDAEARATQERIDDARLAALTALWQPLLDDAESARIAALLPHLLVIGAAMALPPVAPADLDRVFELLVHLAPHVAPEATAD